MSNENVSINDVKEVIMDTMNKTSDELKENMLDAGKALVDGNNEQANVEIEEVLKDTIDGTEEIVSDMANFAIDKVVNQNGDGVIGEMLGDAAKEAVEEIIEDVADAAELALLSVKDEVLEDLKYKLKEIGVKKSTLALVIKFVMEAVENTPIKGKEQKNYALRLIDGLVEEFAYGDDKNFLKIALDSGSISDTIDLIVSATKGELNVNMVIKVATKSCIPAIKSCLPEIMSFFTKMFNKCSKKCSKK
jgi:hypothetical protein